MIDMTPSTLFHIAAGSIALASGAAAVVVRKGGPAHRAAGGAFVVSMLAMCASGSWLAVSKLAGQDAITAQIGAFTAYLVLTSWATARTPPGARSRLQIALLAAGAALTAGFVLAAPHSAFYPEAFGLFIAGLAGFATVLDIKALVRPLAGAARIARHLWRMLFAMFVASASVFVGQQDEFPAALQSNLWFIPAFAPLLGMLAWLALVRLRSRSNGISIARG
jgi:uncharacterized membrane protein